MAISLPQDIEQFLYIRLERGSYAGYKTEFMLERFDNEMCCVFCFGISQTPTRITTCGHIACKSCLESTVSTGILKCPSDSRPFTTHQLQGDASMAKRIGEIEVNCPLQARGCSWAGKLKQCYLHLQSCETRAPNPADYVKCRHCNEEVAKREEAEHDGLCPAIRLDCPNGCQVDSIPRSHMLNHLQDCANSVIPCPLQTMGCEFGCVRYAMQTHMIDELVKHMKLLVASVDHKKTNNFDIQDANLGNLEERLKRLEETIANRDNDISILKSQCKVLSDKIIEKEHHGGEYNPMNASKSALPILPPEYTYSPFCWIVHEVEKKRASNCEVISPGVYSAPGGYCFIFKLIVSGLGMGRDTHLSLTAHICRGSFDSNLVWPVKVKICFTTLNQVLDNQHISLEKKFTFTEPVTPPNTISSESLVIPDFLLYKRLITAATNLQYIKEDTLSILVTVHHL